MVNNYTSTISASNAATLSATSKTVASSQSSELVASFKEIFSTMLLAGSLPGADANGQSGLGMSEVMAPLMLVLLEKLVEQQMDGETLANQAAQPMPSGRPVGGTLTQDFHPGHNGLDFGVVVGTEIKSTMDGEVVYAGWNDQGYGNLVIVQNGDYRTYYAHLSSIPVSIGETVKAGATIGLSGNTGNSTGPHLHYEIRKNNLPIDPTGVTLGVS